MKFFKKNEPERGYVRENDYSFFVLMERSDWILLLEQMKPFWMNQPSDSDSYYTYHFSGFLAWNLYNVFLEYQQEEFIETF